MHFTLAWRNIWRNKRRTWITVAAIGFAVFFSSVLKSSQLGSYARMIDNVARFFTGYIQIHGEGYWDDKTLDTSFEPTQDILDKVANHASVTVMTPRLESFALASHGNQTKGSLVLGIEPETEDQLTNLSGKLVKGELFTANDKAVMVSEGLAKYLKLEINDTLVMISQGYRGVNAAGKYPVKGILKFPAPDLNQQLVYLPLDEARYFYGAEGRLTSLALLIDHVDNTNQVVEDLKGQLDLNQFEVMGWREMMPDLLQQIELDYVGGLIMRLVLYTVIAFGIFGTFLMMVNERKYEFGIMMAIGMHRRRLQLIVFLETALIALTGTVLGIAASLPIILYFFYNPIYFTGEYATMMESFGVEPILPFSLDPAVFTVQAQVIMIITLILALYPLWAIYKLKISTAMRG